MPVAYDLLLTGGRVLDPAGGRDAVLDVAVSGGRIAAVAAGLPRDGARETVDVSGRLVTPGLVDLLAEGVEVHALCHVTGGGLPGNLPRCLPAGLAARVDRAAWTPPPTPSPSPPGAPRSAACARRTTPPGTSWYAASVRWGCTMQTWAPATARPTGPRRSSDVSCTTACAPGRTTSAR